MRHKKLQRHQSEATIGTRVTLDSYINRFDCGDYTTDTTKSLSYSISEAASSSEPDLYCKKPIDSPTAHMTQYDKLLHLLHHEKMYLSEIAHGRRIGFYKIGRELGSGNFSKVKMGIHVLTKERVAIKIMDKSRMDSKSQRLLAREIHNMQNIRHPNIVRLFEVIGTLSKVYLLMEFAGGGSLHTFVQEKGRLEEAEAVPYYAQVLAAVNHMHGLNLVHRDIKAENILFAHEGFIKLGDLGFSRDIQMDTALNTFCGSPPYAAPELYRDKHYYGVNVDIWALGILLYFMVTGSTPFLADSVAELKKVITAGYFTIPSYLTPTCSELIRAILKMEPHERMQMDTIMAHPFIGYYSYKKGFEKMPVLKEYIKRTHHASLFLHENLTMTSILATMKDYGITQSVMEHAFDHKQDQSNLHHITGTFNILAWRTEVPEIVNKLDQKDSQEENEDFIFRFPLIRKVFNKNNSESRLCTIL